MVLTGGLLRRFKCLLTSNFCLEPPSLVEEDTEIKTPHKQNTRTTLTPHPQPITTTTLFKKQEDLVSETTNPKKKKPPFKVVWIYPLPNDPSSPSLSPSASS